MEKSRSLLRYSAAFFLLSYGLAKLNGIQFVFSSEQLRQPLGSVNGFWLTWYYYGYSHIYADILGSIQIIAAILLMFPRTTLLAAMIATPVLTNIVLIDIFFRISWLATVIAAYLLLVCLVILFDNGDDLLQLLWQTQPQDSSDLAAPRWIVRGCIVGVAIAQAVFEVIRTR